VRNCRFRKYRKLLFKAVRNLSREVSGICRSDRRVETVA
jgi:hypothetical protein